MLQKKEMLCSRRKTLTWIGADKLKVKLVISILSIIIWCIHTYIDKRQFYQLIKLEFSAADGFVWVDHITSKGLIIYPIVLYIFLIVSKDENIQVILRKKSRIRYFGDSLLQVLILSTIFSIVETGCLLIVANVMDYGNLINWDLRNTVFWSITGTTLIGSEDSFGVVVMMFFLTATYSLFRLGVIFNVIKLLCKSSIYSYVICIIMIIFKMENRDCFPHDGIHYNQWIDLKVSNLF